MFIAVIGLSGILILVPDVWAQSWQQPPTNGLVSWWRMEEESGVRYDLVSGANLTDNNTVGVAGGIRGNSAAFVKSNAEALTYNGGLIDISGSSDWTIGGWFNVVSQIQHPIALRNCAATTALTFATIGTGNGNRVSVYSGGVATTFITTYSAFNEWLFLAIVRDSANDQLIVRQNTNIDTFTYSAPIDQSNCLTFGGITSGNVDGQLDEWFFYSRALTDVELSDLFNNGFGTYYDPDYVPPAPTIPASGFYTSTLPSGQTALVTTSATAGDVWTGALLLAVIAVLGFDLLLRLVSMVRAK